MSPHLTGRNLRVLLLEDSAADAELITYELERAGAIVTAMRVDVRDAFTQALREFNPNVIISDHSLAQFDARSALCVVRAVCPRIPVIVVSGALDETLIVRCLREGAEGLVLKGNLNRLPEVVARGLEVRERLDKLTPRQVEVLALVVEGHTTREIAQRLQLSVKTVETHRGEIMKRLETHDIVRLVRYALRVGMLPMDS